MSVLAGRDGAAAQAPSAHGARPELWRGQTAVLLLHFVAIVAFSVALGAIFRAL